MLFHESPLEELDCVRVPLIHKNTRVNYMENKCMFLSLNVKTIFLRIPKIDEITLAQIIN